MCDQNLRAEAADAIAALLSQRSIDEASRVCGVGARTLIRWLKLPDFAQEYGKARGEAVQQAVARMQQATGAAGTVALKLMTDPNIPADVRLRAAEFVWCSSDQGNRARGQRGAPDQNTPLETRAPGRANHACGRAQGMANRH